MGSDDLPEPATRLQFVFVSQQDAVFIVRRYNLLTTGIREAKRVILQHLANDDC
jgi:hypothetical protein